MSDQFRKWLTLEMKKQRYSHRALAHEIGMSQSYVTTVLNGGRPPSVDLCVKVADVLGESPENVLRLAGKLPPVEESEDPVLVEATELLRQLPPDKRQDALKYLKFLNQDE